MTKTISILGVTGSIGQSTADVIASDPTRFNVCTVTANRGAVGLAAAARRLGAKRAILADSAHEDALRSHLEGSGIEVLSGYDALCGAVLQNTDLTIAAISGMAGLPPLIQALKHSRAIAIANKEPLVAAGALVMKEAKRYNTQILPIDSEHNAIFQVFDPAQRKNIDRLILTASGGPFREWSLDEMALAIPEQAVAHPNWSMGAKISVDSATMMNKALEIIEAHILFDIPPEQIDVIIHPQSAIHSMVEYADGSILAQMGASDMRTPIAYALAWPERMRTPGARLDFAELKRLDFEPPNLVQFPALSLPYECLKQGQMACLTLNAANEIAVAAFLNKEIAFSAIIPLIEFALANAPDIKLDSFDSVFKADAAVKTLTQDYINQQTHELKATAL